VSHVFPRVFDRQLPMAVAAEGVWITDADGRRYLDGAGGAGLWFLVPRPVRLCPHLPITPCINNRVAHPEPR